MSARDAMAIGTAGYTAMLAVMALERHGITPASGPVVVTGAAGGVGSVAVAILAKLGYQVTASTGRPEEADYLKGLGAAEIIERKELAGRPRRSPRSAGPAASIRSARPRSPIVLSMTRYGGAVAACGLAGGMDLPTLGRALHLARGVAFGHRFGDVSQSRPRSAWKRLDSDLDRGKLAEMTSEIGLADVIEAGRTDRRRAQCAVESWSRLGKRRSGFGDEAQAG